MDILNPVQTSAANMDPARLKKEFGNKLVFWGGGCDTQRVSDQATPEEIREHVRDHLEIFAPGGGYVFNQVHNIQANVSSGKYHCDVRGSLPIWPVFGDCSTKSANPKKKPPRKTRKTRKKKTKRKERSSREVIPGSPSVFFGSFFVFFVFFVVVSSAALHR